MSSLMPFLVLDKTCDQVLTWVEQQLTSADFRIIQTFDLQVARLAHPDCACPHHGTSECNCQMVVLLVYRKQEEPATLVVHGQEDRSWISLAIPIDRRANQHLELAIRRALIPHLSTISTAVEVTYEAQSTI